MPGWWASSAFKELDIDQHSPGPDHHDDQDLFPEWHGHSLLPFARQLLTQKKYPAVQFLSGLRYIDNDKVATAAGETSGIDLALHVVERYYGREIAQTTADFIEYKGELWRNPQYGEVKNVSGL